MLKVAIAGLGAISNVHIDTVSRTPDAQLVAVCDIDLTKKDKVSDVPFYTDIEEMLEAQKPDILHICLPHMLHVPVAKLAAECGINVFMEKPPALNCEELKELDGFEEKFGVKIGVCLQNRYNHTTVKLKQCLREDGAGEIKGCKAVLTWNRPMAYYAKDPWRGQWKCAGSGVMLSQAIHTLDLMTYFCGEPVSVNGMIGNLMLSEIEVEDTAVAQIEFPNQIQGVFYGTVGYSYDPSIELEVACENAVYRICDENLWKIKDKNQTLLAKDKPIAIGKSYYGSGHLEAVQRFYHAVQQNTHDYITLADARMSMKLIDGVIASSHTKGKIKTVP